MKKLKKVVTILLTATLVFSSLSGCSKKQRENETISTLTPTSTAGVTKTPESEVTPTQETTGMDSWTAFSDQVKLKIPVYDRGVQGCPNVSDNYWTKWIQQNFGDKYNIKVEFVPITRSAVMTDYALLASSDDLPTILMEYDYPKLTQWAQDGYLQTFNMEDFAKVAPTYYQKMVDFGFVGSTVMNGETYFCLAERPEVGGFGYTSFYRMDWLKQVGYDYVPQKRAEILDAMQKIKEAGIAEYPMGGSMVPDIGADVNTSYRPFPQNEEDWVKAGDCSLPDFGTDASYELLKDRNEEYNLGLINPEYYITDAATDQANFINGLTYSCGGYVSANCDWLNSFYKTNPDAELSIGTATTEPDADAGMTLQGRRNPPFGMIISFANKATADEMKAAWMYMEWMSQEDTLFTMQWGIEGENYTIDSSTNSPVSVSEYNGDCLQGYNNNKDYWCVTIEARVAGSVEDSFKNTAPQGLPQDFTQAAIDIYYANLEKKRNGCEVTDPLFSVPIDAYTEFSTTLNQKYKEYRDKLTMCKPEEFDSLYKKFAQEYLDYGYQDIMDERLQAFNNGNCTRLIDSMSK